MRTIVFILLFSIGLPAQQLAHFTARPLRDSRDHEPFVCNFNYPSVYPETPPQVADIGLDSTFEFCTLYKGVWSTALDVRGITPLPLTYTWTPVSCVPPTGMPSVPPMDIGYGICLGRIPITIVNQIRMQAPGTTMYLMLKGENQVDTSQGDMLLSYYFVLPYCTDAGVNYRKGDPLPASSVGALRNQQGAFTFEKRVGELRANGWQVEWQRVQFGETTTATLGYWYLLAWCVGTPQ